MARSAALEVSRQAWLGYRWQRHGLSGASQEVPSDLLLLGLQGDRQSSGEQSLAQRATEVAGAGVAEAIRPDGPLVSMWSVRGAPHAHRGSWMDVVREALAPQESDDGGARYLEAVAEVAGALATVVTGATQKGAASTAVAESVRASLAPRCQSCQAHHVPDGIFRAAGRQAQIVLGPGPRGSTMLHPRPQITQDALAEPRLALLQAYLRVNGPTTTTQFRDWAGAGTSATAELWDQLGDVVPVMVESTRGGLPEALLHELADAPPASGVALLPPNDPYLRQVDHTLLVPERARRQQVYRALSGPGALIIDGEVAGTWRYRRAHHAVAIEAFQPLTTKQKNAAQHRAQLTGTAMGDDQPSITWS